MREAATICPRPRPCKLTFDLLTLKVVSESFVTWPTSVHANYSLRPLCSQARYTRQTDVRRASSLNAPSLGAGRNNKTANTCTKLQFVHSCYRQKVTHRI